MTAIYITVWLLVGWGSFSVDNIASQKACEDLRGKLPQKHLTQCVSYESVVGVGQPQ